MDAHTIQTLLDLNRRFYHDFGPAFAATRRRIQDGVRRVLDGIAAEGAGANAASGGRWLDLGCGSGALALEWLRRGLPGSYLGLDFSAALLLEAEKGVQSAHLPGAERVSFTQADLGDPRWVEGLEPGFAGVMTFAALHHVPSHARRAELLRQVHALLAPGGRWFHSEWQFQHSPKLMARVQPWERAGLDPSALEPGDTLLDWRFALPGQAEQVGLRYVHLFSLDELDALARETGFTIRETFESDGQGGRLSVYQVWVKAV